MTHTPVAQVRSRSSQRLALRLVLTVVACLAFVWVGRNVADNMARRGMPFSFGFLDDPFGVDISFHLLPWQLGSSYGSALIVALANTIFTSLLAIVTATLLGVFVGVTRLSPNPLAAGLAYVFVECIRNVPLLTQIIFIYIGVMQVLPSARDSLVIAPWTYLNVRGLFIPLPDLGWPFAIGLAVIAGLVAGLIFWRHPKSGLAATIVAAVGLVILLGLTPWNVPVLHGFSFGGGWLLTPELMAVWLGISVYVSAFIAEIVRSALQGIAQGQREAARALGLHPGQELLLVVLPLALRAMVPPLTNQYLNVVKATTLGAAVAFPELMQVFGRSAMNQTGRSVEIMLIILAVYVSLNLALAALMDLWNRKLELVKR